MSIDRVLKNREGGGLASAERYVLESMIEGIRSYAAGDILIHAGVPLEASTFLLEGIVARQIVDPDGSRHSVAVHISGDFVDLHSASLRRLEHDVRALTDVSVGVVLHAALARIKADFPHLAERLWFLTALDGAIHRQWVHRQTHLNGFERAAHFICEMNARFIAIELSHKNSFYFPLDYGQIGEVCGLTSVHARAAIRRLSDLRLCNVGHSRIEIRDLAALAALGHFTPDYLYLDPVTSLRASGRNAVMES